MAMSDQLEGLDPGPARRFRELHQRDGIFVMPNAWNAGSARLLAEAGFDALGTTSAGIAYSLGRADYEGKVTRQEAIDETRRIARAVDLPVSADLENGFGHAPEAVAETIRQAIAAGAAGASIEDYSSDAGRGLYDLELAAERITAARETVDASGLPFVLTARAECYCLDHPEPFGDSVRRLNRYREAGADCLYAPGQTTKDEIAALVREVDGPVNVVMGLVGASFSLEELGEIGVRRVSIGASLARTTFALVRGAAEEMMHHGTFSFAQAQIPDEAFTTLFRDRSRHDT